MFRGLVFDEGPDQDSCDHPSPSKCAERDLQKFGGFHLAQALEPEKIKQLLVLFGKEFDFFIELRPFGITGGATIRVLGVEQFIPFDGGAHIA
jgi:hypothetical protein